MKELKRPSKTREEWIEHAIATQVHPSNVARNPQKWRDHFARAYARLQVLHAVKRGELVKPAECSKCGARPESTRQIQGHHRDYSQPLNIEWLCGKCHYDKHKGRFYTR